MELDPTTLLLLFFVFVLAVLLGMELITKVPSHLHTPLMSGSNAISGITIVGALIAAGREGSPTVVTFLATLAVTFAMVNVVGGYLVTDRMLKMFKSKDHSSQRQCCLLGRHAHRDLPYDGDWRDHVFRQFGGIRKTRGQTNNVQGAESG